jgi:hypothetical protein
VLSVRRLKFVDRLGAARVAGDELVAGTSGGDECDGAFVGEGDPQLVVHGEDLVWRPW